MSKENNKDKDLVIEQLTVENKELRERLSSILAVIQEYDMDELSEYQVIQQIEEIASIEY